MWNVPVEVCHYHLPTWESSVHQHYRIQSLNKLGCSLASKRNMRERKNHSFTSNKNIMKCLLTKCNITVQPCNQPWMVKLKKGKRKLFVHSILRCKTDTSLPCIKEYKIQHCKYSVKRKEGRSWTKQNEGYESVSNRSSRWKTDIQKTGEIE